MLHTHALTVPPGHSLLPSKDMGWGRGLCRRRGRAARAPSSLTPGQTPDPKTLASNRHITKLPSAPPAPLLRASPQSHSLGPGPAEAGGLPHPSPRGALPLFSLSLPTVSFPPVTNCRSYKHVLPLPPLSLPASNFCQIYLGNVPADRTSQSDENRFSRSTE